MAGARLGGAETFFERLAEGLRQADVEQRLLVRGWPERVARLKAVGLDPVTLPFGGPADLWTRFRIRREIARFRHDVVMSWMSRATAMTRTRLAVHVGRVGHYYDLKYYRHCDHLIANTRDLRRYCIEGGFAPERVHHVPNFYDHRPLPPASRLDLQTPDDAPLIVAVGRLHPNKGFDVLLTALAEVPGAYLWLAGEGPQRPLLEGMIRALGIGSRVRMLGWRQDVSALLATADVMCVPSRTEGFGSVMIEGWACGVPLICASSEGPVDLIEPERTGILVPIGDADALAAALRRVIETPDLARALREAGRAAYLAGYTRERIVARYIEVFEQVRRR